jgi:peroxin-16
MYPGSLESSSIHRPILVRFARQQEPRDSLSGVHVTNAIAATMAPSLPLRHALHASTSTLSFTASALTSTALSLPSTYSNYVIHNSSSVSQIESALRSLTYLLPGSRLHDTELASESVHTFVQLLSIYHDHLLARASMIMPAAQAALKPKTSPHARYTKFWTGRSALYRQLAIALKVAQYTELLWEMVARRRLGGDKARWRVVILLESFKAVCRLLLIRLTNSRPLVSPPLPTREDVAPPEPPPPSETEPSSDWNGMSTDPLERQLRSGDESTASDMSWTMPRTGLALPDLPDPDAITSYLISKVITPDDIKPAKQLLHKLSTLQGQFAEVLYILRPVIYAVLMQRYAARYGKKGGKAQWTPWLVGISIEYLSRQLAKRDLDRRVPGGVSRGLSALEREELRKRGWGMGWWVMRGAFYENVTKGLVDGFVGKLKGKPLLDLVGGVVEDYGHLWNEYYFSTSTM